MFLLEAVSFLLVKGVVILLSLVLAMFAAGSGDGSRQARVQRLKGIKAVVAVFQVEKAIKEEMGPILREAGITMVTMEEAQRLPETSVAYLVCDAIVEEQDSINNPQIAAPRLRIIRVAPVANNPVENGQMELWEWHRIVVASPEIDGSSRAACGKVNSTFVAAAKELAADWSAANGK